MSEYFDLFFAFDLKPDTPQSIIDALQFLRGENPDFVLPPDDTALSEDWEALLKSENGGMTMFPGIAVSELRTAFRGNDPLDQGGEAIYRNTFCYRNEISGDGLDTLMEFFDWIQPYVETQGLIGYIRNEYEQDYWRIIAFDGKIDVDTSHTPSE